MLEFKKSDIAHNFDLSTLHLGEKIQEKGYVLEADLNSSGTVVVGRVRGNAQRPYKQMITLRPGRTGVQIQGTCSCPLRRNCKHIAAVLLETLKNVSQVLAAPDAMKRNGVQAGHLSHSLRDWLENLDDAIEKNATGDEYPPEVRHRIIYVLKIEPRRGGEAVRAYIVPMTVRLNKNGSFGADTREYTPSNIFNANLPKYLRPIDREILHEMDLVIRTTRQSGNTRLRLSGHPQVTSLLAKILATQRCHLDNVNGSVLRQGPEIAARLNWICEDRADGRQHLEIVPAQSVKYGPAAFDAVLPLSPPFYVQAETGLAGPVQLGLPKAIAARLAAAPGVSPSEAAQLAVLLDKRLSGAGIKDRVPLPDAPSHSETRNATPTPRLELYLGDVRLGTQYSWCIDEPEMRGVFKLPMARLAFDYDGHIVPWEQKSEVLERLEKGLLVLIPRLAATEREALEKLAGLGMRRMKESPLYPIGDNGSPLCFMNEKEAEDAYEFLEVFDNPARFIEFSSTAIPRLIAAGWHVSYAEGYPYQIAEGETGWWADVGDETGIDWFSFELGVEFEGERINLAPQLADFLAQIPDEFKDLISSDAPEDMARLKELGSALHLHHKLQDGRLLPLPFNRLLPVLKAVMELIGPRSDKLEGNAMKLHRAEAAALAEAAGRMGQDVAWSASAERLISLGEKLKAGRTLEHVTPPASFKAELRPYQQLGLSWLDFLRDTGFGGVLADDMGLGKTVQTLAFISREKNEGRLGKPTLIVAPTSVLPNWQAEAERFAPDLKVLALYGFNRKRLFSEISNHDLVLTTYPLLTRDSDVLLEHEFHAAILDEAQAIKNPKATVSKLAHRLKADHRLALTGTPLENNLGEVWSLFHFLSPGLLGDETTFRRTFRTPIEKHGCQTAQSFLTRRLKPFMLRRTKQEVATELPPKTEIVERIRLEGAQRDLYETVRVLMHDKVRDQIAKKGLAKSHIVFLDALLKLRQICCDPRLLKMAQARKVKQSAKLERLMQMLPEMVAEGRRILLFSQFTTMLSLIETELTSLNIPYVTLTGGTKDRGTPVKQFQEGNVPVFLLSLKAGGTGLNLTAADTVIHYDPWWNPAAEAQATDRAYRIGQKKSVFVYKFMVEEGIEEAIELLKARKAALADALFAGASKSGLDLTEADISALFAPLDAAEPSRKAA